MKRAERAPYLAYVLSQNSVLCAYCTFDGGVFDNGEYREWNGCRHPLDDKANLSDKGFEGVDCFGFRPTSGVRAAVRTSLEGAGDAAANPLGEPPTPATNQPEVGGRP